MRGFKNFLPYFIFLFCLTSFLKKSENLVAIDSYSSTFFLDIRYATTNNFLKEKLYDCSLCLLLPEVAEALNNANYYFCDRGYVITLFDCYRPLSVQKKMWAKVPNPIYVADPAIGSVHNRGAALDLTLRTLNGEYIDMGTDHDFFGREAHIDNFNLADEILTNRKILQDGMKSFGFATIQSEWWHFNFIKKNGAPVLNIPFPCN
ncbi:MAG: peptidase M15 [Bacteroidetes bacterium HGW-Bacteroidetes-2]|jgi:D-alanyl-D-alanine dipeptidase|nr:MAG: peptidase M15 [Bacteroidetes bacterium HGW-Bacteroidetes-2]